MSMRKIITLLLVLTLLSSAVLAQGRGIHEPGTGIEQPEVKAAREPGQGLNATERPVPTLYQNMTREERRELARERLQQGLTIALTRVRNEVARQRLQRNLERFQERYQQRLERMEELNITRIDNETGAVRLRAKERVRFFGFIKGRATKRFEIDAEGNINERAPWYRIFYREEEPEE